MIKEIDSFSGFWHAVEQAKGATDPKIGKYVVSNWNGEEKNQKLLKDVYFQLEKLIESNPHFSLEDREVGKNIVSKLQVITEEAKKNWDKSIGFVGRWFKFGLFDYDFEFCEDKGPVARVERIFNTYTKKQWKEAFPDQKILWSAKWKSGDSPWRYDLNKSESSE